MFELGPIDGIVVRPLVRHVDERGWLVELFRQDELGEENWPVMAYASVTPPGAVRGPHEHREQADLFSFFGPSDFVLYLWDNREHSKTFRTMALLEVGEKSPRSVLIPAGVVHAYKNIGREPGLVFNAANRLYAGWGRQQAPDEIRYEMTTPTDFIIPSAAAAMDSLRPSVGGPKVENPGAPRAAARLS
jgi:dTDP-4-dehydrorhamnose 3,5-epimerase